MKTTTFVLLAATLASLSLPVCLFIGGSGNCALLVMLVLWSALALMPYNGGAGARTAKRVSSVHLRPSQLAGACH